MKNIVILNIILFVSAIVISTQSTAKEFNELSSIFIVLFSIPTLLALLKHLGKKLGLATFFFLGAFAITFEYFSIKTGIPYGRFEYTQNVGLKILDTVPWAIAFAWVPMVVGCFILSINLIKKFSVVKIVLLSALLLVLADFVLDPGAVALNMWVWEDKSFLYNIPLSNYFGWFISGIAGSLILYLQTRRHLAKIKNFEVDFYISLYIIVGFWTYITLVKQLWIASIVGFIFIGVLSYRIVKQGGFQRFLKPKKSE